MGQPTSTLSITRSPDAVRCPFDWPSGLEPEQRLIAIKREFGRLFPSGKAWKSELVGVHPKTAFIRGNAHDTYGYHVGHPLFGESRYEWFVGDKQQDGSWLPVAPVTGHPGEEGRILLGYLKPDPHASDPVVQQNIKDELAKRAANRDTDPEYWTALARADLLSVKALGEKFDELSQGGIVIPENLKAELRKLEETRGSKPSA